MTFTLPTDWQRDGDRIAAKDRREITAFCDNKSRYLAYDPGLEWTLDAVDKMTAGELEQVGSAQLHGALANLRTSKTASGWFGQLTTISGDNYVTLELQDPSGSPNSDQQWKYFRLLETATVTVHDH